MKSLYFFKLAGVILFALAVITIPVAAFTPVTITDATGTVITISEEPQRIISLTPSVTEILFAINAGNRVVGCAENSDYPVEAAQLPIISSYAKFSMERILSLNPDLLIGEKTLVPYGDVSYLKEHGCTVLLIKSEDVSTAMENFITIGKAVGCVSNAENLVNTIQNELQLVTDTISKLSVKKPTVAHLLHCDPFFVSGKNTIQDVLITAAGCVNAFSNVPRWSIVNLEQLIVTNPDIILINANMGMGEKADAVIDTYFGNSSRFKTLPAYKNNKIYLIDGDLVDCFGPRLIHGVKSIAKIAYPDIFGEYNFENTSVAKTPGFSQILVLFGVAVAVFLRRRS
ncbi:MAG TPA: ABC transporter substrate-binding protein [Methanocorpusculum sp.]|nr:ABC transporter substrate-binding protein [Methanocorpusculum sp.]